VDKVLEQNARTADIVTEGTERVSTVEMGDLIVAAIESGN
jgi:3-isopropylmalate dehydrogenase